MSPTSTKLVKFTEPGDQKPKMTAVDPAEASPYDVQVEEVRRLIKEWKAEDVYVVRGAGLEMDGQDGDLDLDKRKAMLDALSEEDVSKFRAIIMDKHRIRAMKEMEELVLCDDQYMADDPSTFDKGFADHVLSTFDYCFKQKYEYSQQITRKFNLLLGFTDSLLQYDKWMTEHDEEWDGTAMIKALAVMWRELLEHSPGELGIDREFSLPGVMCLLARFKVRVEKIQTRGKGGMIFNFQ